MKKFNFIFASLLCLVFAACNSNSVEPTPNPVEPTPADFTVGYFWGTSTVLEPLYVHDSVKVEIANNEDGTKNITMFNVNFSERMPVTIDMVIPRVSITTDGIITADSIIPTLTSGVPYDKYLVTALEGKITFKENEPSSIIFTLNFGAYPTKYEGEWV